MFTHCVNKLKQGTADTNLSFFNREIKKRFLDAWKAIKQEEIDPKKMPEKRALRKFMSNKSGVKVPIYYQKKSRLKTGRKRE